MPIVRLFRRSGAAVATVAGLPRTFTHNTRNYLVSAFLQSAGGTMAGVVFVLYMNSIGMTGSTLGVVEGAVALAAAVIALIGPALVSRFGYRRMVIGALVVLVAARVGQAVMPMAGLVIACAALMGAGDGLLRAINTPFLSDNSHDGQRSHVFTAEFQTRMAAMFTGGLLGGLMPAFLGSGTAGFQRTMLAGMLLMIAGILPLLRLQEDCDRSSREPLKSFSASVRGFRHWSRLWKLVASQAPIAIASGMTFPFAGLYMTRVLGASVEQVGLIQGSTAVLLAVAVSVTPYLSRRLGAAKGTWAIQTLAIPFLAAVPFVGTLAAGVTMALGRTTLMQVAGPLCNEYTMEGLTSKEKPILNGGYFFVLNLMGFVGSIIGGFLMEQSYTLPYVVAAWLFAISSVTTFALWVLPAMAGRRRSTAGALELAADEA